MKPLLFAIAILTAAPAWAASYRTTNFVVTAPNAATARIVGDACEAYRKRHALEWLGYELPRWSRPCPVTVDKMGPNVGAGGATSFMFHNKRPFNWTMNIQGPEDRLVDAVVAHEVLHTVFATHFGQPLPRWADEGACTTVEHVSERLKQERMLRTFLTTGRGIAFNKMFAMTEYPHDVMPLYSQGYSLTRFLLGHDGGKRKFVNYVRTGLRTKNWTAAGSQYYNYSSLSDLQDAWTDWVAKGSPNFPRVVARTTNFRNRWFVGQGWRQNTGQGWCMPSSCVGIGNSQTFVVPPTYAPTGGTYTAAPPTYSTPAPYEPPVVEMADAGTRSVLENPAGTTPRTPMVPVAPPTTPAPVVAPVVVDYNRIADEVAAKIDYSKLKGATGRAGRDGNPGKDADNEAITRATVAAVLNYVRSNPDQFRGPAGPPGETPDMGLIVKQVMDQLPPTRIQYLDEDRNVAREQSFIAGDPIQIPAIQIDNYDGSGKFLDSQKYAYPGPVRFRYGPKIVGGVPVAPTK